MLKAFVHSPALRVAAAFGVGGAAFSIGNLLLARQLSAEAYGLVSLVIGLISLAVVIAPFGIDLVITRRGLELGKYLRRITLATSLVTSVATVIVGAVLYRLQASLLICLFLTIAAGGVSQAASAHFQSLRQFSVSVPILQSPNLAVVLAGAATMVVGATNPIFSCAILAASGLATSGGGWMLLARRTSGAHPCGKPAGLWGEAIPLVTVTAASSTFLQLERLVIPAALGIDDLATFGVLAALVGSPFRILQAAVGFTIIPRLRDAESIEARNQLLKREGILMIVVILAGSVLIWMLAPYLAHLLLAGRYDLSNSLVIATVIAGVLKVFSAFATAVASALAPARNLRIFSIGSWACVAIATVASFPAARWGLVGVIYAISAGWLIRCFIAGWLCLPHLRQDRISA